MKLTSLVAALAAAVLVPAAVHAQEKTATPTPAVAKYKRDLPAKLVKEAKITEEAAAAVALKSVPNGKIDKMELEKEDGKFIYSYDIKVAGKKGVQEVHVDAMTGALVSSVHETPADEKVEKAKEAKEAKDAAAVKPKKP
jgi:uncharacterized membrane protein YkoI